MKHLGTEGSIAQTKFVETEDFVRFLDSLMAETAGSIWVSELKTNYNLTMDDK